MKTKEITLCGQLITLGYCYAAEITYKDLTDQDVADFMQEAITALNSDPRRMPDAKKTICVIYACVVAYSEWKDGQQPLDMKHITNEATPEEVGVALGTIIALRAQFYKVPTGETEEKTEEEDASKN